MVCDCCVGLLGAFFRIRTVCIGLLASDLLFKFGLIKHFHCHYFDSRKQKRMIVLYAVQTAGCLRGCGYRL